MESEKVKLVAREYGLLACLALAGVALLGYGLWVAVKPEEPTVEIVKEEEIETTITVDVAGAVEKPGVYQLPSGARVGDVLVAAGGLAGQADREWVSKTLNLAEEVTDGQKIYIPTNQRSGGTAGGLVNEPVEQGTDKVNINTASQGELETLNGIGEARAKAIIENRPYKGIEELESKVKIPESVYEKIKDQITIY